MATRANPVPGTLSLRSCRSLRIVTACKTPPSNRRTRHQDNPATRLRRAPKSAFVALLLTRVSTNPASDSPGFALGDPSRASKRALGIPDRSRGQERQSRPEDAFGSPTTPTDSLFPLRGKRSLVFWPRSAEARPASLAAGTPCIFGRSQPFPPPVAERSLRLSLGKLGRLPAAARGFVCRLAASDRPSRLGPAAVVRAPLNAAPCGPWTEPPVFQAA